MRRRNRDIDVIGLAGPLAGLAVLATMMVPSIRLIPVPLGLFALCLLALLIVVVIALRVYGPSNRHHAPEVDETDSATYPATTHAPPECTAALITQLRSMDWYQFEKIVAHAYHKSGYAIIRSGGANPDGGIDLVLERDGERTAVQCKHWKTWNVGVKAVREFLGALKDAGIDRGIFITLLGYTGDAKALAEKHGITILNETGLADILEAADARFDPETLAILNDEEKYCPKCESKMVLRTTKRGPNIGRKFWGCSTYPRCDYKMKA